MDAREKRKEEVAFTKSARKTTRNNYKSKNKGEIVLLSLKGVNDNREIFLKQNIAFGVSK